MRGRYRTKNKNMSTVKSTDSQSSTARAVGAGPKTAASSASKGRGPVHRSRAGSETASSEAGSAGKLGVLEKC
jgi:hypothetical protein